MNLMIENVSQNWNNNKCQGESPKTKCENHKYLESTIEDSVITCDQIIDAEWSASTKFMSMNFNDKKANCKS